MAESIKIVGQDHNIALFRDKLNQAKKGQGSVMVIQGEAGFGKSHLMNKYLEIASEKNSGAIGIYVESQAPIGTFKVGNLQPLLPFSRAMEQMLDDKTVSPEKKFALNLGMTFLAALPLAGDLFYAVKEMGRDYRQFKKDKSSARLQNVSSAAADYFDSICAFADKAPLALLMDDMHFSDAQSVELLNLLAEKASAHPLLIVLALRPSIMESQALPMLNFVQKQKPAGTVTFVDLPVLTRGEIREMCHIYFTGYKSNQEFEKWIKEHSFSVPGVAAEYLRYFAQYSPFDEEGNLVTNFEDNEFLPATLQSLFSQAIEDLSEDEKNILSICSCEGMEFTTTVVSQLLNMDMLTTIKKLRTLQNKTGIIRSLGARNRYGVKSTVYRFTQAFYQSYFENSLEYEEHIAMHSQIAELLKEKYDAASSEEIRRKIAPYIAAHSLAAGDEDTVKSMLMVAAEHAEQYGSPEMVKSAYDSFRNLENLKLSPEAAGEEIVEKDDLRFLNLIRKAEDALSAGAIGNGETMAEGEEVEANGVNGAVISAPIDFESLRREVVNAFHADDYRLAADIATDARGDQLELHLSEKAQLLSLAINSYIMLGDFESAENMAAEALALIENRADPISDCFIYNSCALMSSHQNRPGEAYNYLTKAAERAQLLPAELRLLTMATIGLLMRQTSPDKAQQYIEAARMLSATLNFDEISAELGA
ncbi:MAG: ATP-binding protein [Candidatus Kapaibacterium sp.]